MSDYTLSQWVLFFYSYCFVGWLWECAYVSACQRKWVNRGFLKGPLLPIYGSGAICILFTTLPFRDSIPAMCLAGMVSATILEYVTGYVMEKLFCVRYWDYTGKFLNINGHICLSSTLCWGVMTVLLVKVVHVRVEEVVLSIDERWTNLAVMILNPFFAADFVTSFHAALRLRDFLIQNERLAEELKRLARRREELEEALAQRREALAQKREAVETAMAQRREGLDTALQDAGEKAREQIRQELRELYMNIGALKERAKTAQSKGVRGLLKRNPTAVSSRYRESFAELKQNLSDRIEELRNEQREK